MDTPHNTKLLCQLLHTLAEAALSSARATSVALAKLPSCRAAALSTTVGTVTFAAATILSDGWRGGRGQHLRVYSHTCTHTTHTKMDKYEGAS